MNERAHMWQRIWHVFEDGLQAVKVKAHISMVDVREGRTTEVFKRGNDKADEYAKIAALKHPANDEFDKYRALVSFSKELGRWIGAQEVHQAKHQLLDTIEFPESKATMRKVSLRRLRRMNRLAGGVSCPRSVFPAIDLPEDRDEELEIFQELQGHTLRMAAVFDGIGAQVLVGGRVAMCTKCGGYAWGGVASLARKCQEPTRALFRQRGRMQKGVFPSWAEQYRGWTIGPMLKPTRIELYHLAKRGARSPLPQA
eukprot:9486663-Pyramimonas_sp.AAC.1